jgi:ABC-type transporter Mla MlaB component
MHEVAVDLDGVAGDALTVDALARLKLALVRQGHELRLEQVSEELLSLFELVGLRDVLVV